MPITTLDRPPLEPVFRWTTMFWKGIRPVVIGVLGTALAALLEQLLNVDLLVKSGVPTFVAIGVVEAGRNFWKQHRA